MIFISILSLIVAKALSSLNSQLPSVYFTRISAIVFIYSGVLSFNTFYIQSIGSGIGIYNGLFQVTVISQSLEVFLLIIGSLILIAWPLNISYYKGELLPIKTAEKIVPVTSEDKVVYEKVNTISPLKVSYATNLVAINPVKTFLFDKKENFSALVQNVSFIDNFIKKGRDYSLIVLFSSLGSCLLISSSDLVSMYLSIELQSFGLYILATLYRNSESSTSAGLKYFLLGGLSSCLILLGSGLIYAFTGLTQFGSIYSLISVLGVQNISATLQGLSLGFILIFVGFLFKIAAAPLHNWSPDVYDDTPTIVTIWLTIMPKISILLLLLEIYTQAVGSVSFYTLSGNFLYLDTFTSFLENATLLKENSISLLKSLLLISSLLSLIIGTVVGLAQIRIKRLLAYSTISHIGFILLALAINTEQSIDSLLFYIVQYSISNLNIFLIIIALSYITISREVPLFLSFIVRRIERSSINRRLEPKAGSVLSDGSILRTIGKSLVLQKKGQNKNEQFFDREKVESPQPDLKTDDLVLFVNIKEGTEKIDEKEKVQSNAIDIRYISEFTGQFLLNPVLSLSLAICLFSMAGIPPLIGFFSKQFVLYSALGSGYYFMSFLCIIVSVISASYYLKIIKVLYSPNSTQSGLKKGQNKNGQFFDREKEGNERKDFFPSIFTTSNHTMLTNFHSFLISTLTLFILLFIFKPSLILNSTQLLSLSLFYF